MHLKAALCSALLASTALAAPVNVSQARTSRSNGQSGNPGGHDESLSSLPPAAVAAMSAEDKKLYNESKASNGTKSADPLGLSSVLGGLLGSGIKGNVGRRDTNGIGPLSTVTAVTGLLGALKERQDQSGGDGSDPPSGPTGIPGGIKERDLDTRQGSSGGNPLDLLTGLLGGLKERDLQELARRQGSSGSNPLDLLTGLLGGLKEREESGLVTRQGSSGGNPLDLLTGLLGGLKERDDTPGHDQDADQDDDNGSGFPPGGAPPGVPDIPGVSAGGDPSDGLGDPLGGGGLKARQGSSGGSPLDLLTGLLGGLKERDLLELAKRQGSSGGNPLDLLTGLLGGLKDREDHNGDVAGPTPGATVVKNKATNTTQGSPYGMLSGFLGPLKKRQGSSGGDPLSALTGLLGGLKERGGSGRASPLGGVKEREDGPPTPASNHTPAAVSKQQVQSEAEKEATQEIQQAENADPYSSVMDALGGTLKHRSTKSRRQGLGQVLSLPVETLHGISIAGNNFLPRTEKDKNDSAAV